MKLSTSVIPRSPFYSPIRGRLLITLTLDEGTLDMMLRDELTDDFYDVGWHRHGFDKVATGIGECLSFGRISRYGKNLLWPFRRSWTQGYP